MSKDANRIPPPRLGKSFPILFERGCVFRAHAALDGVSVGCLAVNVVCVDFQGPIACEVGFTREKEGIVYGSADAVVFTALDPTLLAVSVKETTAHGVRLYLTAFARGTPVLQARLGAADGPVIAQQEIDEFTVECSAATHVVINAANDTGTATPPALVGFAVGFMVVPAIVSATAGRSSFFPATHDAACRALVPPPPLAAGAVSPYIPLPSANPRVPP